MALQQAYRQANLNKTFRTTLEDRLVAIDGAFSTRMFFNDVFADPTALDDRFAALTYWVNLRYISGGVGLKRPTIFQIDCYYPVGTEDSPTDRYGSEATEVADKVQACWTTSDLAVRIYDHSTSDTAPIITAETFLIRNTRGQWGHPEERVVVPARRGLNIEILTYHVWHRQDLHKRVPVYF